MNAQSLLFTSLRTGAALGLAALAASAQTTYYVDDNHPSDPSPGVSGAGFPFSNPFEDGSQGAPFDDLQKAIDAASSGDTVLVLPSDFFGYYALNATVDFTGKSLEVRSTEGADVTVLSGLLLTNSPGVYVSPGSGPGTVLEGFTIEDCDAGSAVGVVGGGLRVLSAEVTVRDCRFRRNSAYNGGGVGASLSDVQISGCEFLTNDIVWQGGGLFFDRGEASVERCFFRDNTANFGAGFLARTNPGDLVRVSDCVFWQNEAFLGYAGGLAKFDQGILQVERCTFAENTCADTGSAIQVQGSGSVRDCVFVGNEGPSGTLTTSVGGSGGGGTMLVLGCTFTENLGGAVTEAAGSAVVRNSIAWNNSPFELGAGVDAAYCNVLGGYPGTGNLDLDPMFRDVIGQDGVIGTLDDDLRLRRGSPCIDAGNTLELGDQSRPVDRLGRRRVIDDPTVVDTGVPLLWLTTDLGAYEAPAPVTVRGFVERP